MRITKRDRFKPSLEDQETIEMILKEASAYGLRDEVDWTARSYLEENKKLKLVIAYQWAFLDWVK